MTDPYREIDPAALDLARSLLANSRHASLAVIVAPGQPMVTLIALGQDLCGRPLSLISGLAAHTQALMHTPACSLLLREPGAKGDALSHPRLTLLAQAQIIPRSDAQHDRRAAHYVQQNPKAKLYLGLGDFTFVQFQVDHALLNAGFGKAYRMTAADLGI